MKKHFRKNRKGIFLGLVIAIAVFLCIYNCAVALETTTENKNIKDLLFKGSKEISFDLISLGETPLTAGMQGNVLVSINSEFDDILPDITTDQNGNYVVTWTSEISILESDMGFAFSKDNGNTWNSYILEIESIQKYANSALIDTTKHEGGGTYNGIMGSWIDPFAETYGAYMIPDIDDEGTWYFGVWPEGGSPGIDYNKVEDDSFYLMTYFDQYSMVMASVYDSHDLDRGLVCYWIDAVEFGSSVENWDAESAQASGPAQDPDLANVHDTNPAVTQGDYFYLVWQKNNPSTGKAQIGYKEVVPIDESDIEYVSNYGWIDQSNLYDAAHPDIEATPSRAVVAYMTNNNIYGDWDIGIAYTTDRGQTWTKGIFAANQPQVDETYPALYMSDNNVYCAYIKQGNLYLVESDDGGVTWGDPIQINEEDGTVVAEENSLDISAYGIVWTDNRNGNKDIYYAPLGTGPNPPSRPSGPTSVRKNRQQTYTTSTTDPGGSQVYYLFDWGDGTDSGWLGPYASGATAEGSHAWSEDGDYQIRVKAKNENDQESPWSEPLPISVPRNRIVIFGVLQKMLERFKTFWFIFQ